MNDKYEILMARCISGEASEDERRLLEEWLNESPANRLAFDETKAAWEKSGQFGRQELPQFEEFWTSVVSRLDSGSEPSGKTDQTIWSKAGEFISDFFTGRKPGYAWAGVAAAAVLSLFAVLLWTSRPDAPVSADGQALMTYTTKNAERMPVVLPDGSMAELNAGSSITYYKNFTGNSRQVSFSGQAFFSIKKDGRPFVIQTSNAEIRVLGTRFEVKARSGKTEVGVKEGSVAFKALRGIMDSVVVLKAGQQSICEGSFPPAAAGQAGAGYIAAWLQHKLVFRKTPLTEIADELERTFDKKIILSGSGLGRLTVTGEFKDQDLEQILSSICLTLNLKSIKVKEGYLVSR
ncbi:MAG: FecR family protein [Syntrophothermus sp.]